MDKVKCKHCKGTDTELAQSCAWGDYYHCAKCGDFLAEPEPEEKELEKSDETD